MSTGNLLMKCVAVCCWGLTMLIGCGGGDESPQVGQTGAESPGGDGSGTSDGSGGGAKALGGLPTASIGAAAGGHQSEPQAAEPEKGSGEWLVREIIRLRLQPLPKFEDADRQRAARRRRNEQIIDLAREAISMTHDVADKAQTFTAAVHHLMEARLQLALQGGRDDIDALYEHAESLYERKPDSKAAAEAAFAVARFANENARRFAQQEPRWLEEFSRQARLFAVNFPQEQTRAVPLLFTAGRSCELNRQWDEAVNCYTLLLEQFPESPQAQQAVAILRRIHLKGKSLVNELAGPTLDGGFVRIGDYRGQVVLVAFWSSDNRQFAEQVPQLIAVTAKYEKAGLRVIGVNLDAEEPHVAAFIEKHALSWPQIFYPDRLKRRWDNPIVKYYGIRDIPMLWLIDRSGVVADTMVEPAVLEAEVRQLLAGAR